MTASSPAFDIPSTVIATRVPSYPLFEKHVGIRVVIEAIDLVPPALPVKRGSLRQCAVGIETQDGDTEITSNGLDRSHHAPGHAEATG